MIMRPSGQAVVSASTEQVSCDLAGEVVILGFKRGAYYGLEGVAASVWGLLQTPSPVSEIVNGIIEQYTVEPERCEQDLLAFLAELADEGLIEVRERPGS